MTTFRAETDINEGLDTTNPIVNGVVAAVRMESLTPKVYPASLDMVDNKGTPSLIDDGVAMGTSSTSIGMNNFTPLNGYPFTTVATVTRISGSSGTNMVMANPTSLQNSIGIGMSSTGDAQAFVYATAYEPIVGTSIPLDEEATIAFSAPSSDKATWKLYAGGVRVDNGTLTGTVAFPTGLTNLAMGELRRSNPTFYKGQYHMGCVFNRTLSDAELASITADPYQIFRTAEDARNDYGLTFDGISQYVTSAVPPTPASNFSLEMEFYLKTNSGGNQVFLDWGTHTSGVYIHYAGGALNVWVKNNAQALVSPMTDTYTGLVNIKMEWEASTTTATFIVNDGTPEAVVYTNPPAWLQSHIDFAHNVGGSGNSNIQMVFCSITDPNDPANGRYYDFNRTSGTIVPDLLGGQDGTLVGFTGDEGWQPIIPKIEFTESDYADAGLFVSAQKTLHADTHPVYLIATRQSLSANYIRYSAGQFPNGVTFRGIGAEFVGNMDDLSVAGIFSNSILFRNAGSRPMMENLVLECSGQYGLAYSSDGWDGYKCSFKHNVNGFLISSDTVIQHDFKNCVLDATAATGQGVVSGLDGARIKITDSILMGRSSYGPNPLVEVDAGAEYVTLTNCLVHNSDIARCISDNTKGSNNFTNNANGDNVSAEVATVIADWTGAFVNG